MPNGDITLTWGDGEHLFNVAKIGQALELEEKCSAGINTIFKRLSTGEFYVNDFREVIRLGLIGGGMTPLEALRLVRRYVDDRPFIESVPSAIAIIAVALVGVPGDDVGKKPTTEQTMTEPEETGLSAPSSMEPVRRAGSRRAKSTKSRSGNSPPASTELTEPTAQSSP